MKNAQEPVTYDEIREKIVTYFRSIAFTAEQRRSINERTAVLFYDFLADRSSVEDFCAGMFRLLESMYEISLTFPEEVLAEWYQTWDRKTLKWRPLTEEELETETSPLASDVYLIGSFLVVEILKRKPKVAKSPVFYRFVRDVILDSRFETGRTGFIEQLLPKCKTTEGIDFAPFLTDKRYAGDCFRAFLKLKDGRFVKEAEKFLEIDPKNFYKRQIKRYIERYKTEE